MRVQRGSVGVGAAAGRKGMQVQEDRWAGEVGAVNETTRQAADVKFTGPESRSRGPPTCNVLSHTERESV